MMSEESLITNAQDSDFDEVVVQSDMPCLVDFWAKWCGPCKMLNPIVTATAERWQGKLKCVKVDVDSSPNTAAKYGVRGIPTLMVFHQGEMKQSKVGLTNQQEIDQMIQKVLEQE
jgi:thioredoxin 1